MDVVGDFSSVYLDILVFTVLERHFIVGWHLELCSHHTGASVFHVVEDKKTNPSLPVFLNGFAVVHYLDGSLLLC